MTAIQAAWPEATYKLTQRAFMPLRPGSVPQLLEPGTLVTSNLKPGPHMAATDAIGEANHHRAGDQTLDPFKKIALIGRTEDDLRDTEMNMEFMLTAVRNEIARRTGSAPAAATGGTPPAPPAVSPPPPPPPPPGKNGKG